MNPRCGRQADDLRLLSLFRRVGAAWSVGFARTAGRLLSLSPQGVTASDGFRFMISR